MIQLLPGSCFVLTKGCTPSSSSHVLCSVRVCRCRVVHRQANLRVGLEQEVYAPVRDLRAPEKVQRVRAGINEDGIVGSNECDVALRLRPKHASILKMLNLRFPTRLVLMHPGIQSKV